MHRRFDAQYKVVVVGASGVGKTALVQRLVQDSFSEERVATVGVEFSCYLASCGDETVKLNIWDTAGQERFRAVSKAYFRDAVGALLVYAFNDQQSFDDLALWLTDLQTLCAPNAVILLIGNKSDLLDERVIALGEATAFATRHGLDYCETSALKATNVTEVFVRLAATVHGKAKTGQIRLPRSDQNQVTLLPVADPKPPRSCC
jgi:small GTP-binding protein